MKTAMFFNRNIGLQTMMARRRVRQMKMAVGLVQTLVWWLLIRPSMYKGLKMHLQVI